MSLNALLGMMVIEIRVLGAQGYEEYATFDLARPLTDAIDEAKQLVSAGKHGTCYSEAKVVLATYAGKKPRRRCLLTLVKDTDGVTGYM
jgi:hypothetical protein